MVGVRGFEPPTSRSRTARSTKLSHTPKDTAQATGSRLPYARRTLIIPSGVLPVYSGGV